jgi:inner membrane transporter RhtA
VNGTAAVAGLAAPGGGGGPPRPTSPGSLRTRAAALAGGSAPLLVIALAVSMHLGSAVATGLFGRVGPLGVLWLRCALAALLLVAVSRGRALRLGGASRGNVVVASAAAARSAAAVR